MTELNFASVEKTFASDTERRVLAHVAPTRDTLETLVVGISRDQYTERLNADGLSKVLDALEDKGFLTEEDGVFETTNLGKEALSS